MVVITTATRGSWQAKNDGRRPQALCYFYRYLLATQLVLLPNMRKQLRAKNPATILPSYAPPSGGVESGDEDWQQSASGLDTTLRRQTQNPG